MEKKQHNILVLLTLSLCILFYSISLNSLLDRMTTMTKDFPTNKHNVTKHLTDALDSLISSKNVGLVQ